VPNIPAQMTFADSVQLNITLLLSVENCNGQLEAIREIESSRQQTSSEKISGAKND